MSKLNWMTKACSIFLLWATAAVGLPAQTFTTLHSFASKAGANPVTGMIQATDGNQYGTTQNGGVKNDGTVFKITPGGILTTLHSFDGTDGSAPEGSLVQGSDGNLYGTTYYGGAYDVGTIFTMTPSGTLTTLHSFPRRGMAPTPSGHWSWPPMETFTGRRDLAGPSGYGTIFTITPGGILTILHSFDGTDGRYPVGGWSRWGDETFYGATSGGGTTAHCEGLCGTVFKITANGGLTTLHSFGPTEGNQPLAGLILGTDGNLYGTTFYGAANSCLLGCGTIFTITPSGTLTTLHEFDGTDGQYPAGVLAQATDGNFYGTTEGGGANNSVKCSSDGCGTIFTVTPSGTLTTIYNFCSLSNCTDGNNSYGGLVQATNGYFYGVTEYGGISDCDGAGCGTVFSLSVGLKPFVETQPTFGAVGTPVNILGTNLTDATGVTFNGTPAAFTVVSKTLITTTVPVGATTGTVEVVTPNGKGLSNVPFTVLP